MNHQFVNALEDMLSSVAIEAATESLRQFQIMEEQRKQEAQGDRLLLRSHEAAEHLAISTATLDRLTRSGDLPCVRLGRSVRYSTETIREWIRGKESAAKDDEAKKANEVE